MRVMVGHFWVSGRAEPRALRILHGCWELALQPWTCWMSSKKAFRARVKIYFWDGAFLGLFLNTKILNTKRAIFADFRQLGPSQL